jgi:hypothetical protein
MRTKIAPLACALALLAGTVAPAHAGRDVPKDAACESVEGRFRTCEIRTDFGIRLQRQLSRDDCVEGESFGVYGPDVMWVDRGCRGIFASNSWGALPNYRGDAERGYGSGYGQGFGAAPSWSGPGIPPDAGPAYQRQRRVAYVLGRQHGEVVRKGLDEEAFKQHALNTLARHGITIADLMDGGRLQVEYETGYFQARAGADLGH